MISDGLTKGRPIARKKGSVFLSLFRNNNKKSLCHKSEPKLGFYLQNHR